MNTKQFKFGIEMEHNIEYGTFCTKVGKLPKGWTVKYEHCGTEVTSPPLVGHRGIFELRSVLRTMWKPFDQIAFENCGLHIHVDISKFSLRHLKRLALLNSHFSDTIFSIMSPVRRNNKYTYPNDFTRDQIISCSSLKDYVALQRHGRYYGMNIHAFHKFRTVEFRYAAGTMDWHKIYALLALYLRMVSWAYSSQDIPTFPTANFASLTETLGITGPAQKLLSSMITRHKKADNRKENKSKILGIRI